MKINRSDSNKEICWLYVCMRIELYEVKQIKDIYKIKCIIRMQTKTVNWDKTLASDFFGRPYRW